MGNKPSTYSVIPKSAEPTHNCFSIAIEDGLHYIKDFDTWVRKHDTINSMKIYTYTTYNMTMYIFIELNSAKTEDKIHTLLRDILSNKMGEIEYNNTIKYYDTKNSMIQHEFTLINSSREVIIAEDDPIPCTSLPTLICSKEYRHERVSLTRGGSCTSRPLARPDNTSYFIMGVPFLF